MNSNHLSRTVITTFAVCLFILAQTCAAKPSDLLLGAYLHAKAGVNTAVA